jgi:leader peptidase (prepilin peptidase) / N-methyltransferase
MEGPTGGWWTLLLLALTVGGAIGSFLNVVAGRLPEGRSVVTPPSACPRCGHAIRPWDNLPVVSWLLLRGRCRDCKTPISARYPFVELLGAGLWGLIFLETVGGPSPLPPTVEELVLVAVYGAFFSALLAVSLIDVDHFIVPDVISLPLVPLGITTVALLDVAGFGDVSFPHAVFGAIAGAGVMLMIAGFGRVAFGREAMGMGDVKLVAAIGAWLGLHPALLLTVFGGALYGSAVGIVMMTIRGRGKPSRLPFGPYLCAGALTAWLWGEPIVARLFPTL